MHGSFATGRPDPEAQLDPTGRDPGEDHGRRQVTRSDEAAGCLRVSAEAARGVRASAIGLNCAVGAVVSTVEALCDSELSPTLRERRSQELYGHIGELHRA